MATESISTEVEYEDGWKYLCSVCRSGGCWPEDCDYCFKTETLPLEFHEHPLFNEQYHLAVWVQMWAAGDSDSEPPPDCPEVCAVCGKPKDK